MECPAFTLPNGPLQLIRIVHGKANLLLVLFQRVLLDGFFRMLSGKEPHRCQPLRFPTSNYGLGRTDSTEYIERNKDQKTIHGLKRWTSQEGHC